LLHVTEGIKISIATDNGYSYSYVGVYLSQYTFTYIFQQYTLVKSVHTKSDTFS
jgi:hypothetical protein